MEEQNVVTRRADGALETEVLRVLWAASSPLSPGEVREQLSSELAYTTVMTVLSRLHDKELVRRSPRGRAFEYEAAVTESELTARRMEQALSTSGDRAAALSGFVGRLSKRDIAMLRRAMGEEPT